jgi:predicted acyl esterase
MIMLILKHAYNKANSIVMHCSSGWGLASQTQYATDSGLVLGHPHPGAQGWLRVPHRELDPALSTPSEPYLMHRRLQLLRPKEIVPVETGIWPTSMVWHAGQQLRVVVRGHYVETRGLDWWESFKYESLDRGTCIIHTGGKYDSHLLAPIIRA